MAAKAERPPLDRHRVFAVAVAVADSDGLESLSMRKLAQQLGVEAMSLYHHVRNKAEILDGMVETIYGEIELPSGTQNWKTEMTLRACSLREAMTRHPWAIALMSSRTAPGPATLRHHDAVIGSCLRAGLSVDMAARAFALIDNFVFGYLMQERTLPFEEGDDIDQLVHSMMPPEMEQVFPSLYAMTTQVILKPGYSYAAEFDFGLALILDGLEAAARQ